MYSDDNMLLSSLLGIPLFIHVINSTTLTLIGKILDCYSDHNNISLSLFLSLSLALNSQKKRNKEERQSIHAPPLLKERGLFVCVLLLNMFYDIINKQKDIRRSGNKFYNYSQEVINNKLCVRERESKK